MDWLTIFIVAVCVFAIGFLIYRITTADKIKPPATPPVEEAPAPMEEDEYLEEDLYSEDDLDYATGTDEPAEAEPLPDEEPEPVPSTYDSAPAGRYLVIAGSFQYRHNAENFAKRLRQLDYPHAESKIFDRGKYAVVVVDQFDDFEEARRLVERLKADGISDAYVQPRKTSTAQR